MPEELKLYEPLVMGAILFHQNISGNQENTRRRICSTSSYTSHQRIRLSDKIELMTNGVPLKGTYRRTQLLFRPFLSEEEIRRSHYTSLLLRERAGLLFEFKISNVKNIVNEVKYQLFNHSSTSNPDLFILKEGIFNFTKTVRGKNKTEDLEEELVTILKFLTNSEEDFNQFLKAVQDLPLLLI